MYNMKKKLYDVHVISINERIFRRQNTSSELSCSNKNLIQLESPLLLMRSVPILLQDILCIFPVTVGNLLSSGKQKISLFNFLSPLNCFV